MAGYDDRHPPLVHPEDEVHHELGCIWVHAANRLIRQEDLRGMYDGPCKGQALSLTTGKIARHFVHLVLQTDPCQNVPYPRTDIPPRFAGHFQDNSHIIISAPVVDEPKILKDKTHVPPEALEQGTIGAGWIESHYIHLPAGWLLQPEDKVEEGGLPRSGGPQDEATLLLSYRDAHIPQGIERIIINLSGMFDGDHLQKSALWSFSSRRHHAKEALYLCQEIDVVREVIHGLIECWMLLLKLGIIQQQELEFPDLLLYEYADT